MAGHRHVFHFIAGLLAAGATLAGCTWSLAPKEYALPAGTIPTVRVSEPVSVRAGKVDRPGRSIHLSPYDVEISYQAFTDEAVRQLEQALTAQAVPVAAGAPRSIELTVMYVDMVRSGSSFGCVIDYRVKMGDGVVRGLQAREQSWNFATACNAAVAMVSAETLRDASVKGYLTGQPLPAER